MARTTGCYERGFLSKVALVCCCCLSFSLCAFAVLCSAAGGSNSSNVVCLEIANWMEESSSKAYWRLEQAHWRRSDGTAARRRGLLGPGSRPPRCGKAKCGGCAPCSPVQVPVPPSSPAEAAEYYPVAWRCRCAGRLYVP